MHPTHPWSCPSGPVASPGPSPAPCPGPRPPGREKKGKTHSIVTTPKKHDSPRQKVVFTYMPLGADLAVLGREALHALAQPLLLGLEGPQLLEGRVQRLSDGWHHHQMNVEFTLVRRTPGHFSSASMAQFACNSPPSRLSFPLTRLRFTTSWCRVLPCFSGGASSVWWCFCL